MKTFKSVQILRMIAFTLLAMTPATTVFAQSGANGSGGAHSASGHQLLDLWENKDAVQLQPLSIAGVQETLQNITDSLPGFAIEMKKALTKKWFLDRKPLLHCPGGESLFDVKRVAVACQNQFEIRINYKWFLTPPVIEKGDLENELYIRYIGRNSGEALRIKQHGTIIHELLRNLRLKKVRTADSEAGLRYLVRELIPVVPNQADLKTVVALTEFGHFSSATFVSGRKAHLAEVKQSLQYVYGQITNLIAHANDIDEKLKRLGTGNFRQILADFQNENNAITRRFENKEIGRAQFQAEVTEAGNRFKVKNDALAIGLNQSREAIERPGLELHRQIVEKIALISNHPLTIKISKDNCYFDSISLRLESLQAKLNMPQYLNQNEWSSFVLQLNQIVAWERMAKLFSEIESSLLTCEQ